MRFPSAAIVTRLAFIAVGAAMLASCRGPQPSAEAVDPVPLAAVQPGKLAYYPSGEYLRNGYPVTPSRRTMKFEQPLKMMARQVSQTEYAECVNDKACKQLDRSHRTAVISPDLPVVGVSWRDATDYAAWFSKKTGQNYRLPSYEEWVYAAGSSYKEDVILDEFDPADPAQRWLAEYALETQRKTTVDAVLRPFGGFSENEHGFLDMAGNVWDWTDTCQVRRHLDLADGESAGGGENCGVRVVAGPHRSYITDFIRDPKSGACSVGVPPSNLGFRLVRDDTASPRKEASLRERLGIS